jgi:hypothetical protein
VARKEKGERNKSARPWNFMWDLALGNICGRIDGTHLKGVNGPSNILLTSLLLERLRSMR